MFKKKKTLLFLCNKFHHLEKVFFLLNVLCSTVMHVVLLDAMSGVVALVVLHVLLGVGFPNDRPTVLRVKPHFAYRGQSNHNQPKVIRLREQRIQQDNEGAEYKKSFIIPALFFPISV